MSCSHSRTRLSSGEERATGHFPFWFPERFLRAPYFPAGALASYAAARQLMDPGIRIGFVRGGCFPFGGWGWELDLLDCVRNQRIDKNLTVRSHHV